MGHTGSPKGGLLMEKAVPGAPIADLLYARTSHP
jgi:hypothetical protein